MAHFVEIDVFHKVIRGVVLDDKDTQDKDGNEKEEIGAKNLHEMLGGTWLRTSYNTYGGIHLEGKTPFRKNYAGKGFSYDKTRDAFISPQPYTSWVLNEDTCQWESPVERPEGGEKLIWNEDTQTWVERE
tara:strand:- start:156 stop:545 length:390 start_codon:yes stop_codon:yes gene_type:complete